ncbi:MAG TPA: hypothetical protein VGO13_09785 [Solirubrobacterales bacterium]|jgi:hypothetical protein|nr:hypothetical protein [Solirubrobacterales bacterium]
MSVSRRALFAVLAIAVAAALLPALAASAGKNSTKIVVSLKFPAFHGKLTSPRGACLGSRTVKMYREKGGKKKQLGKDTSEDNGKWAIPVGKNLSSGAYYATVAKRGKCKAAKSQVLTID